jgi:lysophospholipase L1-like esterase
MRMRRLAVLCFFLSLPLAGLAADNAASPAAKEFFFKDGDTIVMIGDSITEQHLYSTYVEMWTLSRFPQWKLTFRNVGIGGDRSPGGNSRFKRDVLAYRPTTMTVDFGMNDGGYRNFDENLFHTYVRGLQGMAEQARKANIRVAWITPQPTERREPGTQLAGYNLTLEKFSEGVKEIAEKSGGVFVDQFHPYLAVMDKARAENPKALIMGGDAIHPGPPGQTVMAWAILKGLHFPALVSSVDLDLKYKESPKTANCQVSGVKVALAGGAVEGVSFERTDHALPFFPADARSILHWAPILDELNRYELKIKGLPSGRFEVRLGGVRVAEHTAEELSKGVNLAGPALVSGPVAQQVDSLWKAVIKKNRYFHDRIFRGVVLSGAQIPDWLDAKLTPAEIEQRRHEAYAKRMERMPELDEGVRQALRPRGHLVEIVSVGK